MRKTTLAATLLTAAVLLAGCGSNEPDSQVASGTGAQPETTASRAPPSLSRDEMALKFTQCLREQGLNVPDPEPGKGRATARVLERQLQEGER